MLRIGYVLFMTAVALGAGYGAYWFLRLLFGIGVIPLFLKIIVALALLGLILVFLGLIRERLRQGKEV